LTRAAAAHYPALMITAIKRMTKKTTSLAGVLLRVRAAKAA
jgi:hypothetical protein